MLQLKGRFGQTQPLLVILPRHYKSKDTNNQSKPIGYSPELRIIAPNHLYRSVKDRKIAGVAGRIAAYLKVDSAAVRLIWLL